MLAPMLKMQTVACTAALLGTACAGPPAASEGDFDSPSPGARMYAIEEAIRQGDTSKTPQLVEQLDCDDPAVRMLAISALQRLTGVTYGYHYDDPPYIRRAAIQRWVDAVNGVPAAPPGAPGAPGIPNDHDG